jgi:hypothetical protein
MWQDSTSAIIPGGLIVILTDLGISGATVVAVTVATNISLLGVFINVFTARITQCYLLINRHKKEPFGSLVLVTSSSIHSIGVVGFYLLETNSNT